MREPAWNASRFLTVASIFHIAGSSFLYAASQDAQIANLAHKLSAQIIEVAEKLGGIEAKSPSCSSIRYRFGMFNPALETVKKSLSGTPTNADVYEGINVLKGLKGLNKEAVEAQCYN